MLSLETIFVSVGKMRSFEKERASTRVQNWAPKFLGVQNTGLLIVCLPLSKAMPAATHPMVHHDGLDHHCV